MGKTLYLECYSGISGDMTVGALLDLGADETVLRKALESLQVDGYHIVISRVQKSGLDVCDFHVKLDAAHENHDHDMEYLHGTPIQNKEFPVYAQVNLEEHKHSEHRDCHEHHEHSEHQDCHEYHGHSEHQDCHKHHQHHEHRGLLEIQQILRSGELSERALSIAERIFQILAEAEAKAHGVLLEEVHFHEVGAVDSIVDIAAVAVCLDNLDIEEVIVPELYEGHGMIRCQHGRIPVPVPAVCRIAETYHLNLHRTDVEGELVTPTGAAIVAAVQTGDHLPENFCIEKIGMGAGKRTYAGVPGFLRAMLLSTETGADSDVIYKLEANLDDCSGELLGYVMERLFLAGARDVNFMPLYMKKNRPACQLNVICSKEQIPILEQIIFAETTTIGIRRQKMERTILEREVQKVSTVFGVAEVKVCRTKEWERAYPEFESAARLARSLKLPLQDIYRMIEEAWKQGRKTSKENSEESGERKGKESGKMKDNKIGEMKKC